MELFISSQKSFQYILEDFLQIVMCLLLLYIVIKSNHKISFNHNTIYALGNIRGKPRRGRRD